MGATIDPTGQYRYSLWRQWDDRPQITFIMLNPSTADANTNDATIRRCIGFARAWGYGRLEVVNLFAYRTTHPRSLMQIEDAIGPDNDRHLLQASQQAQKVILAWGNWGRLHDRHQQVLQLLQGQLLQSQSFLYHFGITQAGYPRHPLYLSHQTRLLKWR